MNKKVFLLIAAFALLIGCTKDLSNTPTKKVEAMFTKYQTLDKDVLEDLDKVIKEDENFNTKQRDKYRKIMKKHYGDLVYSIKDETVNGDDAIVEVEIEVTNYADILKEAEKYRREHETEFYDEEEKYDVTKFIDYKLDKIEKAKEKIKYTLEVNVSKRNDKWTVDSLSNDDKAKIHGVFED